jgi:DNA-binding transcriptional regulator YiaG
MSALLNDMTTLATLTERIQARRELPAPSVCRALRKAAGVSLDDVANVVGVSRQAVAYWETGARTPRGANLTAYLEVLQAFKRAMSGPEMREAGFPASEPRADADVDGNATTRR